MAGAAFAGAAGAFSSALAAEAAALATGAAGAAGTAVGGDVFVGGDAAGAVGCANATDEIANRAARVSAVFIECP